MPRAFTLLVATALLASISIVAAANFGYTETSTTWVVTTGAGLVVTMSKSTCDITSLLFNNNQLQYKSKGSQVNSGLGTVTSSLQSFTDGKASLQVTCSTTGLTQYFFFRANENTIYMGTYHSTDAVMPELRFLGRFAQNTIGSGPTEATVTGGTDIEFGDIFLVGSQTRTKYYSAVPFINDKQHNVYGSAGAAYMVLSDAAYETSIGGPFFRDINEQIKADCAELTFYMNSNHTRTEQYRYGFHGPYALAITSGGSPSGVDFSFVQNRQMTGFVPTSGRGYVSGSISDPKNVLSGASVVVHFFNKQAQYWTTASGLSFKSPAMKPGTYTAIVYKKQLEVGTSSVTVSKGTTTQTTLSVTFAPTTAIWRIGDWDGTPDGFLNADKIQKMHPSDSRMAAWKPMTFIVGQSQTSDFPLAQFRGINDPITIQFSLTATQAASARKLRIGVSVEYLDARIVVTANGWKAPVPSNTLCVEGSIAHCVDSRSITRGVTHGNNVVYEYSIPTTYLKTGTNTITLGITSATVSGPEQFIKPSVAFDALELV